jgi:glycosyltransferase involved in cell wall biosynthesis
MVGTSVVISTFNQASTIQWTLASLVEQKDNKPFEVIICDDGSNEETFSVVSRFANDLDLRYVWHPNLGFRGARSRNNGIRSSQGDVLIFIDGDIVVKPDFVAAHQHAHDETSDSLIIAGCRRWLRVASPTLLPVRCVDLLENCVLKGYYEDRTMQIEMFSSELPWAGCLACNVSLTNKTFVRSDEKITGYGHEDYELFCRLYHRENYKARLIPSLEVCHLVVSDEDSWSPWVKRDHSHISQYVRNCLYVLKQYSDVDIAAAMWPLTHFILKEDGNWHLAAPNERLSIRESIATAMKWVEEHTS